MTFAIVVGIIASVVLTVMLCLKVLPEKFDGTFEKKSLQFVHDYFNFKKLYLESVLKILFTLASVLCIVCGLLMATVGNIFEVIDYIGTSIRYEYFSIEGLFRTLALNLFGGLGIAVLAPIALRLVYEGILMFILLVKNVIDINGKLDKKSDIPEIKE